MDPRVHHCKNNSQLNGNDSILYHMAMLWMRRWIHSDFVSVLWQPKLYIYDRSHPWGYRVPIYCRYCILAISGAAAVEDDEKLSFIYV
jgi:hypothetical protein